MRALLINVVNCLTKIVKIHHISMALKEEKLQKAPNYDVLSPHSMLKVGWANFFF
jgi:hypothetical protein